VKEAHVMTVGEFCNRDVVIIRGNESLHTAAGLMRDHRVGSVVVVEDRGGKCYPTAILTDRDLVIRVLASDARPFKTLCVRDVAVHPLITARDVESLETALARMRAHGVRRLPVVDKEGTLQGIVSFDDLVEHLAEAMEALTTLLKRERAHEARHPT
jgi:CBS domain-containing protein